MLTSLWSYSGSDQMWNPEGVWRCVSPGCVGEFNVAIYRLKQQEYSQLTLTVNELLLDFCNAVQYPQTKEALGFILHLMWSGQSWSPGMAFSFAAFQCLYCIHPQCALHGFSSAVRPIILCVSQSPNWPWSCHSAKCARREALAALIFLCPRLPTQHHNLGDEQGTWRTCFCPGTFCCARRLSGALVLVSL